ncbi:MAG TPA: TIGR03560 family F420-dependent LLM class oxidoreductase [Acidimicrobiales bacterium]
MPETLPLPSPCLVVLVGPAASGKTTWAERWFTPDQVVSSDRLRALVGESEHDLAASKDAFALLDTVLQHRMRRRLTTVVDTLGLDPVLRARCRDLAARAAMPCFAIAFDVPAAEVRARNKARATPVPGAVLAAQLRGWPAVGAALDSEGFAAVHPPGAVELVPASLAHSPATGAAKPTTMRFGLQLPRFTWPGGPSEITVRLREIAAAAEQAGFDSVWVMDHFRQIPGMGQAWEDMLESWTTLGFLAATTERVRLGTMVSGITYRNVAYLGKIAATLDVLSGGRAVCGLGLGWFQQEHAAYGWDFPSRDDRYALLEDALQLLPLLWGPGTPAFSGRVLNVPEAMCYPRPLQERLPLLVGGSGERRTLRLVARYADACNLFGEAPVIRHKVEVLERHCAEVDRDPTEIEVTQLSTVLVGDDRIDVESAVERLRPKRMSAERFAQQVNAGTVEQHIGRFRQLGQAGVQTAIVSLPDVADVDALARFGRIITALS